MASVGINGCSINNVNADTRVISAELLPEVARIADVFRPWGVKLLLSLDFASPRKLGGISTFDPLDPAAVAFWKEKVDEIYKAIPDLGGFVLKADSEGRLGPSDTAAPTPTPPTSSPRPSSRTAASCSTAASSTTTKWTGTIPRTTAPRPPTTTSIRSTASSRDNVVLQIKHGPIDFQVREPPSPLFGGLPQTNQAIELQITQEYLGQQRHLCFLVPMWKEVLDFDMQANPEAKGDATSPA